jgi:ABC-type nitrate/sulfonate/bicarbonate transport system ATPase subunit
MARLRLEGVGLGFRAGGREIRALDGVDLELEEGRLAVVVGPSGSGKTTLLRVAAGLLAPDAGRALLSEGTKLGFVFQEPRLLGSLTAEGNIALGLGSRKAEREGSRRVDEILELLGLGAHRRAYPSELSGGLAQRVALGRALVRDPELLLMDEPFSALDAPLRRRLQDELLAILAPRRTSVLFVTHDLVEALYLGDRVIALRSGRLVRDEAIELPRPRDPRSPAFVGLLDSLASTLGGGPLMAASGIELEARIEEDSA